MPARARATVQSTRSRRLRRPSRPSAAPRRANPRARTAPMSAPLPMSCDVDRGTAARTRSRYPGTARRTSHAMPAKSGASHRNPIGGGLSAPATDTSNTARVTRAAVIDATRSSRDDVRRPSCGSSAGKRALRQHELRTSEPGAALGPPQARRGSGRRRRSAASAVRRRRRRAGARGSSAAARR